jgi:long-chain acyl-CoA synthetase
MTTPARIAETDPDRPAVIYGNGETVETYGQLEERSRRIGVLLREAGLVEGDCVAVYMGNDDEFFDVFWACHRVGLYFTPVNWHLQLDEIRYIVDNCDAKALFAHARFGDLASRVGAEVPRLDVKIAIGGEIEGFDRLDERLATIPIDADLPDQREGAVMLYSSGTTGRPKGVRRALPRAAAGDETVALFAAGLVGLFGLGADDRYLSPAPLYHAAPLVWSSAFHRTGAATIIMRKFEPEEALRIIQDQEATASQWVPTHFRRMLALPEATRGKYDVSSMRVAVHAAAPCPIPLKEAMIDWWGDKIFEYYAGTEGGGTLIRSGEWLSHKGSVGRHWAGGKVLVLDEEGNEVTEPRVEGAIYFEAPASATERFSYYKDDSKTAGSYRGDLYTLGDIGYVDEDGYLYLTDRQSNMIISGGVNIYPQETENHLIMHPLVEDVAVIGVPNDEMGEEVKAVVVLERSVEPAPELAEELIDYCRQGIAHYKCPRSIDFATELPRTETGKMAKRKLRAKYWESHGGTIV